MESPLIGTQEMKKVLFLIIYTLMIVLGNVLRLVVLVNQICSRYEYN